MKWDKITKRVDRGEWGLRNEPMTLYEWDWNDGVHAAKQGEKDC